MTAQTGTAIAQSAFEDAGLCSIGQTISAAQTARGISRLNDIINLEATQGIKLWLNSVISVPLVAGQAVYRLGPAGVVVMAKPLQILQGYYLSSAGDRTPLNPLSREEYTRLSNTTTGGAVNSYFVDKQYSWFDVSFWNVPDANAALGTVGLVARVSAPNLVVAADNCVFPPEWAIFLRWALADELATGQPQSVQDRCAGKAAVYRDALEGFDVEDAPTRFAPDFQGQSATGGFR